MATLVLHDLPTAECSLKDTWVQLGSNHSQKLAHKRQNDAEGEALNEERYSLEALNELRAAMDEYLWNALFMQNPMPEG